MPEFWEIAVVELRGELARPIVPTPPLAADRIEAIYASPGSSGRRVPR